MILEAPLCPMCAKPETRDCWCHRCNQSTMLPGRIRKVRYGYVTAEGYLRNKTLWEANEGLDLSKL